jgi:hypothetical protein
VTEERKDEDRKAQEEESREALAASESESDAEETDDEQDEEETEEESNSESKPGRSQTKLWIAIGIGVAIAVLLVMKRGGTESATAQAEIGSTTSGDLTLVPADRNELECAAEKAVEGYQCGFADENQARTVDESKKLRPFMTIDRHLYLIPGLFLEKSVAQRYNMEPPNKPRPEQKRFTAKCKIKVVGELDNAKLRWSPTGSWEPPKKFPVATVSDCAIEG